MKVKSGKSHWKSPFKSEILLSLVPKSPVSTSLVCRHLLLDACGAFTMAVDGAECIFLIHVNFANPYKLFIKIFIPIQKVLEIFHTPTYGPQYSSTTCSLIRIRCFSSIPPCPLRVRLFYFKCNLYAGNSTVYINTMQD